MSANRAFVFNFFQLPRSIRREILLKLELLSPQQIQENWDTFEILIAAFTRAKEHGKVEQFRILVNEAYDKEKAANGSAGR